MKKVLDRIMKVSSLLLLSSSCLEAGTWQNGMTLNHGGQTRSYDFYTPDGMPASAPLVVVLHGNGGNSDYTSSCSGAHPLCQFSSEADQHKFYIAAPEALDSSITGDPYWNDCRNMAGDIYDDAGYIEGVVNDIASSVGVDMDKVFIAGHSNGGAMAFRMAKESTVFSAMASINAGMATVATDECIHSNVDAVGVLMINGTADSYIPYQGGEIQTETGGFVRSVDASISYWVSYNQTDTTASVENLPNINTSDNSTVTSNLYGNGNDGTNVLLYTVTGGEHSEPSIAEQYPHWLGSFGSNQNHDIESAEVIWNFFDLHCQGGCATTTDVVYQANSVNTVNGNYVAGNTNSLNTDDNNFYRVDGGWLLSTEAVFSINESVSEIDKITINVISKDSRTFMSERRLSLYNYSTSTWDQISIDTLNAASGEKPAEGIVLSNFSDYISGGNIRTGVTHYRIGNGEQSIEQLLLTVTKPL